MTHDQLPFPRPRLLARPRRWLRRLRNMLARELEFGISPTALWSAADWEAAETARIVRLAKAERTARKTAAADVANWEAAETARRMAWEREAARRTAWEKIHGPARKAGSK